MMSEGKDEVVGRELIIDRFEGESAIVEVDGTDFVAIPRWILPADAAEDDIIVVKSHQGEDGTLTHQLLVDSAATKRAREEAATLVERLRRRDPGGDFAL